MTRRHRPSGRVHYGKVFSGQDWWQYRRGEARGKTSPNEPWPPALTGWFSIAAAISITAGPGLTDAARAAGLTKDEVVETKQ